MKLLLAAAGLFLVVGCASPYQAKPIYMVNVVEAREELTAKRGELEIKKRRLSSSKLENEIAALRAEIAELEKRIEALELSIAHSEKEIEKAKQAGASGSSGTHRGPRGGCYTITKSGKKNYGGC